jgi:hopanoid biosynthesis associated radical SAM protein HpnJ
MKLVFFLNPPSYEGFDGGAGSRYQAKREVRSFWFPTWLAQAAALCPNSRLLDAPAEDKNMEDAVQAAKGYDVLVIYTSTPGYRNDAILAERFRERYPEMLIGMVGPHTTVLPEETLAGCKALNFVTRGEFDYTIVDIARGMPLREVEGISYRKGEQIIHNKDRRPIEALDALPSVLDVYKRDLTIEKYFIGYLLHPYLSLYTGRGCPGRCTFCLWPQTIAGRTYKTRSVQSVLNEMTRARQLFPQVREFFFDDDTFTAKIKRTEEIARGLKKLAITWSCSTRANVPEKTLRIMKESGLRCVMVGIESGNDNILKNIRKGITTSQIRTFMKACRKLGITTHATFMLGLPGETRETIKQTIQFAKEVDSDTLQVSVATPYPGTEFYQEAMENNWLIDSDLVSYAGVQQAAVKYSNLSNQEIFDAVETFYHKFYFRLKPIARILATMLTDRDICIRRLREAKEFFLFMKNRKKSL